MFDIGFLADMVDKLGVIQAVKGKLLRQPDPAAERLSVALQEISKVFLAIDAELVRYLSLHFDPADDLVDERAVLLSLEGGALQARLAEARGHCHKIGNIYVRYLSQWFHRVLTPSEAEMLNTLFTELGNVDMGMLQVLDELAAWLSSQVTEALNLVDAGKLDEANTFVRKARVETLPVRQAVSKAMSNLMALQADFIAVSGQV